jgi:hypothetical protein
MAVVESATLSREERLANLDRSGHDADATTRHAAQRATTYVFAGKSTTKRGCSAFADHDAEDRRETPNDSVVSLRTLNPGRRCR